MNSTLPDAAEAAGDAAHLDLRSWIHRLSAASAALGTILVALGAWLLVPRDHAGGRPTLPPLRVCLVDVSSSAVMRRSSWSAWIEGTLDDQAQAAQHAGEELCTILYGNEVRRDFGPAPARTYSTSVAGKRGRFRGGSQFRDPVCNDDETRFAPALETARALVTNPARGQCRLVLLGDDTFTGADPTPLLRELRDIGVVLERVELPPPYLSEITIGPLALPREVEEGAPIAVEAEIFYAPGAGRRPESTVTLQLKCKTASEMTRRTIEIPVLAGIVPDEDGYLRWRARIEVSRATPGLETIGLAARKVPGTDDGTEIWSEGVVRCKGRLVIGAVWDQPLGFAERPDNFLFIPSDTGLQVEVFYPEELASRLDAIDALVTCDIRLDSLPTEVLSSFVQRGGGWLCLAGNGFLPGFTAVGRAAPADGESLLPLGPPDEKPEPRDIVVLVDRSGSMAGEPFENIRGAVLSLVEAAPARDAVELRFFGTSLSGAIPLKAAGDLREEAQVLREAAERFRANEEPGGSTAIARSLESFAAERERSRREALVFLLTDGRDTVDPDAKERCARVLPRLLAARARIVVLGAGEEPDRDLLSKLVADGEELRTVGALDSGFWRLSDIFRRELSLDRIREGRELRVLPSPALLDPTAPASIGSDVLRAQKPDQAPDWPTIQRYLRAKAVPGAEVLWVSERGEPLLAFHRVGLGATAACAFAPIQDWDLNSLWAHRGDVWAPLLRALARGKRELGPVVRTEGDELTVEDLPADAPAELEARVFSADANRGDQPAAVIALWPPAQGGDPRRVRIGRWPQWTRMRAEALRSEKDPRHELGVVETSFPRVEIRAREESSKWAPVVLPLALPQSPEFVLPRPRLRADDLFTGASEPGPPSAGANRASRPLRSHPSAPWVLFSGLLLLTFAGLGGFFARRTR